MNNSGGWEHFSHEADIGVRGNGRTIEALPIDRLREILRRYGRLQR